MRWHTVIKSSMQQRDQRKAVRCVILSIPENLWLMRQGVPDCFKTALQELCKSSLFTVFRFCLQRIDGKYRATTKENSVDKL